MDSFLTIKIEISIYRRLPGYEQRLDSDPPIHPHGYGREFDAELNCYFFCITLSPCHHCCGMPMHACSNWVFLPFLLLCKNIGAGKWASDQNLDGV